MKKLSLIIAIGINTVVFSQSNLPKAVPCPKPTLKSFPIEPIVYNNTSSSKPVSKIGKSGKNTAQTATIIQMGEAANALGGSGGCRTQLWADPSTNSVILIHRSNPGTTGDTGPSLMGTGYLRYDVSKDGGATWIPNLGTNEALYKPQNTVNSPFSTARYPQAVIYNPASNTNPDNAYISFYAPNQTSANGPGSSGYGGWGGNVYGVYQLNDLWDPSGPTGVAPTKNQVNSSRYVIPEGMTITKTGVIYVTDLSIKLIELGGGSQKNEFHDSLLISRGTWNSVTSDFDFTFSRIPVSVTSDPSGNKLIAGSTRVAFSDDGNTGYIVGMGHTDITLEPDTIMAMMVYKTTDAGTTWSASTNISLNNLNDSLLGATGVKCQSDGDFDAVVDANGNLHIVTTVTSHPSPGGPGQIFPGGKAWGLFDIFTTDGGSTWAGIKLASQMAWGGLYGDQADANSQNFPQILENNRVNASRSWDGTKLFFTYFDTDTTVYPHNRTKSNWFQITNIQPDMYTVGYDLTTDKWTKSKNMTYASDAEQFTTFGMASYYVFDNAGTYTIPAAYQELTGNDPQQTAKTVTFKYINGATVATADFNQTETSIPLSLVTSTKELNKPEFTVSGNYPNPFSGITTLTLSLEKASTISIDVCNTLGEKVLATQSKSLPAGNHSLDINGSTLAPGIYLYTIKAGTTSVTKKMTVK